MHNEQGFVDLRQGVALHLKVVIQRFVVAEEEDTP
jgi:hypothetical protein